ncbi:MAG: hypothetical protein F6K24_18605 [Okeania sp. SIO2D1]|nr:hypothetical protein [Okeania sp. SIO2D1]
MSWGLEQPSKNISPQKAGLRDPIMIKPVRCESVIGQFDRVYLWTVQGQRCQQ